MTGLHGKDHSTSVLSCNSGIVHFLRNYVHAHTHMPHCVWHCLALSGRVCGDSLTGSEAPSTASTGSESLSEPEDS